MAPALTLEQRQGAIDINVRLKGPLKGLVWVGDSCFVFWARETERWGPEYPPIYLRNIPTGVLDDRSY